MNILKMIRNTYTSLIINLVYAIGNCAIGFVTYSWWYVTLGAYYSVLTVARFSVLQVKRKSGENAETELFAKRIAGVLLIALSFCLIGINILSVVKERGSVFHEIIMIAVATYTFAKITLAVIGLVKARGNSSPVIEALRNISLTDAFVSIYSLQRSMLVSFSGIESKKVQLFNILTGTAVWLFVLLLGINLIGGRCVNMAKSKLIKANEKIAETVVDGYKKVEKGVVGGYKKIEQGVVSGYSKIEDKFVNTYLAKDGESVEEAKARLKKENKQ